MTSPISNIVANSDARLATTTPATSKDTASASKNAMNKDMFLKLLVAQLKYQDPSKPVDSSQFMAQTAQFSMVEKLEEIDTGQQDLLAAQLLLGASNLVGRTVSYVGTDGTTVTGVVKSATISGSNPTVRVGDTDVALSSVKEVQNTAG